MFGARNIFEFLRIGGISMYLLFFCSVVFLGVFIERIIEYYRKSRLKKEVLISLVREDFLKKDISHLKDFCAKENSPLVKVIESGLENIDLGSEIIQNAMSRSIAEETKKLEKYTSIVGTISNVSVYLGLLGTVLGIIKAFEGIASAGSSNVSVVIKGVAEALSTTAVGLIIAIPSSMAYNYFMRKIEWFSLEMENVASEFLDILKISKGI